MSARAALPFALITLGLALGALADPRPAIPIVRRGGMRVLEADFHAHTRFSDGLASPVDVVIHARRRALDAVAITEHNLVFPARIARAFSRAIGGPTVIVGEEITQKGAHVIALGLEARVRADQPLGDAIDEVHRQGGVAIAAHPVAHFRPALDPLIDRLDGSERMHPFARSERARVGWDPRDLGTFYDLGRARRPTFAAIGSSDFHGFSPLGAVRTLVFVPDVAGGDEAAAIVEAIRQGKTVTYDRDGAPRGDPWCVAQLLAAPMPTRDVPGYEARGGLDVVGRLCGWLGLAWLAAIGLGRRVDAT